jgi:hypothetical protein
LRNLATSLKIRQKSTANTMVAKKPKTCGTHAEHMAENPVQGDETSPETQIPGPECWAGEASHLDRVMENGDFLQTQLVTSLSLEFRAERISSKRTLEELRPTWEPKGPKQGEDVPRSHHYWVPRGKPGVSGEDIAEYLLGVGRLLTPAALKAPSEYLATAVMEMTK